MNLTALINETYGLTNRPDLEAVTKSAVKAATLKMHQMDFWDRDLVERGIQFVDPAFVQTWDVLNDIPRFRALKYIRNVNGVAFDIITPDHLFDYFNLERVNVAYLSGSSIKIKSRYALQACLTGVYVNPDITDVGFSSWVSISHPYAIIYEAARTVFKNIGLDAEAAEYQRLVAEQAQLITISNVSAKGS